MASDRTTPAEMATLYQREAADFQALVARAIALGDTARAIRCQRMAADCYRHARDYHALSREQVRR